MRILHLADLHFCKEHFDEAAASIHTAIADHDVNGFDLIAIAGDTWDGPVQNTAGARFADFLTLIRALAYCAPVAMIYGTPSHDTEGSLEVFEKIDSRYGITIIRPGQKYFLVHRPVEERGEIIESPHSFDSAKALLLGVPEPNKKWLLANAGATGKDEADEAARSAMRGLFLGLGGMRKEHADLPCILLYHGQVSGAKSATGYEAASGLMASRDDLAMVGADYYALGDIHLPQQIGTLPAYYPGKLYPGDWKEVDYQAGCNIVEIEAVPGVKGTDLFSDQPSGFKADVSRLDFPHPVRTKINHTFGEEWTGCVADKLVWVETTATRQEAAAIDTDALLAKLLAAGALEGSRVTLNILPTETVRAGDITEKKALREKVQVYAENSSLGTTDAILKKADELEREAAARRPAGSGAYLRVDRLILRGAHGLWKKSRKDEIDLNLEAYGPGVMALVGHNGAGKTTILENMHPWPTLLTREGTLKDQFRLKDSFRDLYVTDERTGWRYRCLITIRADIDSGTTEYNMFRDQGDGKGFQPYGGTNGRKEPYEQAVNELFGSLEMYLRTAFIAQRATKYAPDISAATKGERKALFAELSGIDYLEGYKLAAKAKADAIDEQTRDLRAIVQNASGVDGEIETIAASIVSCTANATLADKAASASAESVASLQGQRDATAAKMSDLERKAGKAADLEREIAALLEEVRAAEGEIKGFQDAAGGREAAAVELANFDKLDGEAAALRKGKADIDAANHATLIAHQEAVRGVEARRRTAQAALDMARRRHAEAKQELAVASSKLAAPVQDHCPTCAQLLPDEKRAHLQAERKKIEVDVARLGELVNAAQHAEMQADLDLSAIVIPPAPVPLPFDGADRLNEIERALDWIVPAELRETIRKADEAKVRIEAAQAKATASRGKAAAKRLEVQALAPELAQTAAVAGELAVIARDLEAARTALSTAQVQAAAARSTIAAEERALAAAQVRKNARDKAEATVGVLALELADWRFLERACGPDGIQALELDALSPGIADIANRLLKASGNEGRIEFRTTRIGGKGSKTKQIEDFLVYYIDDAGDEQEIATLSGGEGVWVKKALTDAFSIIRARNQGIRFQTVIMDEADGALDPAARMRYLRMLEAAHAESGRYQTLLVTHSPELQAMIQTVVDVTTLEARRESEVVAA